MDCARSVGSGSRLAEPVSVAWHAPAGVGGGACLVKLSGWGRFPQAECRIMEPRDEAGVRAAIASSPSVIARGNGRAYGDAALNPEATILVRRLEHMLDFDAASGLLVCEAGTLLSDIVAIFVPRGWFVPVTPGTKSVTVGGMVAADVHGKNHRGAGSFARHVRWLDLMLADGSTLRCSPDANAEVFEATLGGMGLTGIVLRVAFTLVPVETDLILQETVRTRTVQEAMDAFEHHAAASYGVAWIDTLASGSDVGRSVLWFGEHALRADLVDHRPPRAPARPRRIAFDFPGFALNRATGAALNRLYFAGAKPGTSLVSLDRFFYPLDALADWNRLYGRRGFVQYQLVLPDASARTGIPDILKRLAADGPPSFLAVLKRFGPGRGMMSFPTEGFSLAFDFAASAETFAFLASLDALVDGYGGRVYLAKDAPSRGRQAVKGYPGLEDFRAVRRAVDPARRFSSLLSQRLGL